MNLYIIYHVFTFFLKLIQCGLYTASDQTLDKDDIEEVISNQSEVSCILHCERDENCTRIGYQLNKENVDVGNCLLVKKKEREQEKLKEVLLNVTVYAKVRFYISNYFTKY